MTNDKRICCVIGDPISQSKSPLIHNAAFKALGIDSEFVFTRFQISTEQLEAFIDAACLLEFRGVSVTLPHKQEVIKFLHEIDDSVRSIGAVNTIVLDNGKLMGSNTDWHGIVNPLKRRVELADKKVLILGAGGAARAAIYGLKNESAVISIANRTTEKAISLAEEFGLANAYCTQDIDISTFDIVINTTSVGMYPQTSESLISPEEFQSKHIVFDLVYNPLKTKMILNAESKGATTISGMEMFIEQGARQFELYTGRSAPIETMERVLNRELKNA